MAYKVVDKTDGSLLDVGKTDLLSYMNQPDRYMIEEQDIPMFSPETKEVFTVPYSKMNLAKADGYQFLTDEDEADLLKREELGSFPEQLKTVAESAAETFTMGASTKVLSELDPEYLENRKIREEENPISDVAGAVLGTIGSVQGGALRAARAGGAALAGSKALSGLSPKLLKAAEIAIPSLAEGFVEGVGVDLENVALGNKELAAESLLSSGLQGAFLDLVATGAVKSVGAGVNYASDKANKILKKIIPEGGRKGFLEDMNASLKKQRIEFMKEDPNFMAAADEFDNKIIHSNLDTPEDYLRKFDDTTMAASDRKAQILQEAQNSFNKLRSAKSKNMVLDAINLDKLNRSFFKSLQQDPDIWPRVRNNPALLKKLESLFDVDNSYMLEGANQFRKFQSLMRDAGTKFNLEGELKPNDLSGKLGNKYWSLMKQAEEKAFEILGKYDKKLTNILPDLQEQNRTLSYGMKVRPSVENMADRYANKEGLKEKGMSLTGFKKLKNETLSKVHDILDMQAKYNEIGLNAFMDGKTVKNIESFFPKNSSPYTTMGLLEFTQTEDPDQAIKVLKENMNNLKNPESPNNMKNVHGALYSSFADINNELADIASQKLFNTAQDIEQMIGGFRNEMAGSFRDLDRSISRSEHARLDDYFNTLTNPYSTIEKMADGTLSVDNVRALKTNYPALYTEFVTKYMTAANKKGNELNSTQRAALKVLAGSDFSYLGSMQNQIFIQDMFKAQRDQQNQERPGPKPKSNIQGLDENEITDSQRISAK